MIALSLYPRQLVAMVAFLSRIVNQHVDVPLLQRPVSITVLIDYQTRLSLGRIFSWSQRDVRKTYRYSLPVPVASALHQELQRTALTADQLAVLHQLDKAIVDYQTPAGQRALLSALPYA